MADAQTNTDPLVQNLLARFQTPPATPNIIPFQQAKQRIQQQQADLPVPQAPALQPTPQNVPTAQVTDVFKAMSSPMMLMALLGGAFTAQPITGALKNATGFLNGLHQGDAEATKNHLDEFNKQLDAAKTANTTAIDQYKLAFDQYSGQADKLKQQLASIADSEGDTILKYKLDAGQFDEVYKIIEARERNQERLENQRLALQRAIGTSLGQPQMVETKDGKQVLAQQDKAGLITGTPGQWVTADENHTPVKDVTGAVSATTAGLPEANQGMADMIAHYAAPPLTGYALRSASGQQIMADVQKINPQYNANIYPMIGKTLAAFATGPQGTRLASINVAIQHLDVLQSLSDALGSGDSRAINSARQSFEKQFGSPAPTNFDAIKNIVGQEVVKAVVAGGGGEAERQEAANAFNRIGSPEQLSGAIQSVEKLMAGQVVGLRQQYNSLTAQAPGVIPFDNLLLPETKKALSSVSAAKQSGPTLDEFLKKAKPLNPGVSDDDLKTYWENTYGGNGSR